MLLQLTRVMQQHNRILDLCIVLDLVLFQIKKALKWYNFCSEQGNAFAQYNLGRLYYLGNGVRKNMVYAHMWVNLASSNEFEMAKQLMELITELMTPSQIEEAERLARECVKKNYKGC